MAQQETEEQTSSDQPSSGEEAGRHRVSDEGAASQQSAPSETPTEKQAAAPAETPTEKQAAAPAETPTEKQAAAPAETPTEKQAAAPAETPTEKQQSTPAEATTDKQQSAPAEAKTEQQAPAEATTEKQARGAADTSWAEPETPQRRHVDVGEIAWRAGNVIATVLRTLALLFALVLIVNVVLVLVGVNPANGVAQFIGGLANLVILGFRDLFVPSDPTIALIVNSLVAAVFWVFVGELLSRLIRFLAARVK